MRSGSKDELYEVMGRCFVNTQQPVNRIFDNLFTDSNTLMFEGETIFEVQEVTDTLDEFLVEAGQDLVEALLAGVQKAPPDVRMVCTSPVSCLFCFLISIRVQNFWGKEGIKT